MMKRTRLLLIASTALVPLAAFPTLGNPLDANVVAGSVSIEGTGTGVMTINQSTDKAIIDWKTFDIGGGEITTFVQPNASSVVLNRVTGGLGPSEIIGTLQANGQVYLINRDGILFGKDAVIDTASLVATTHDILDEDFLDGSYNFNISGNPSASVVNLGTITVDEGGFAALVAPGVRNDGVITARLGKIGLASSDEFSLDLYGDGLITLAVGDEVAGTIIDLSTGETLKSLVSNGGLLSADGGTVQLTAASTRAIVDAVINNTGNIEANSVGLKNGKIVLSAATSDTKGVGAPPQVVRVSGNLSAAGKMSGESGGDIEITGEQIELVVATIDAFGWNGGGTVLVGGDVGGGNPDWGGTANDTVAHADHQVANAVSTTVDAATTINASATVAGEGGKVVVWSDDATRFEGMIVARGGDTEGDGGFVEVSGHARLAFSGVVDVGATLGEAGTLLLDPQDITIGGSGTWVIDPAALEAALVPGVIVVVYTNSGYAGQGDINVSANLFVGTEERLFLVASRNIVFTDGATIKNYGDTAADCCGSNLVLASGSSFDPNSATISYAGSGTISFQGSSFVDFTGGGFEDNGDVLLLYDPGNVLTNELDFVTKVLSSGDLTRWTWIGPDTAMDLDTSDTFVPGDLSSWEIIQVPAKLGSAGKIVLPAPDFGFAHTTIGEDSSSAILEGALSTTLPLEVAFIPAVLGIVKTQLAPLLDLLPSGVSSQLLEKIGVRVQLELADKPLAFGPGLGVIVGLAVGSVLDTYILELSPKVAEAAEEDFGSIVGPVVAGTLIYELRVISNTVANLVAVAVSDPKTASAALASPLGAKLLLGTAFSTAIVEASLSTMFKLIMAI